MSNSPEGMKEQVPESETTSADSGVGASSDGSAPSDSARSEEGGASTNVPATAVAPVKPTNSWPLVRKFEALIFMAMFAAVPLFAVRVIQYTHDQLIVRNVSKELVKDLQRAKTLAVKLQSEVEVSGSASKSAKLFSYVVLIREQVSEEVILPERVSVVGSIKFNKSGLPEKASSFIVSSENRTTTVEIDPTGLVSVPF